MINNIRNNCQDALLVVKSYFNSNENPNNKQYSIEKNIVEQENKIFFTLDTRESITFNTVNHKFKYSHINQYYFQTVENFLNFSNTEQFDVILNEFINTLNQFKELVIFYFEDDKTKTIFNNDINILIERIKNKEQYRYHDISIVNLFKDTKYNIYIINQILDNTQNQLKDPQNKTIISFNKLQILLGNTVAEGLELCLEGVYTKINKLYRNLESFILGKNKIINNAKHELAQSLSQEFTKMYISYGDTPDRSGTEVHKNTLLENLIADRLGIKKLADKSAIDEYLDIDYEQKNEFINRAYIEISTANLTKYLANDLYDNLCIVLQSHKIIDLLTGGMQDEEIPAGAIGDIEENFLANFHMQYQIYEEDRKIKINDILSYKEDQNDWFYNIIENIKTKLHVWVVKSLLPETIPTILVNIPQHLFCCDEALVIARLGNCYFWVTTKNSFTKEQKYSFDYSNKSLLNLNHLTENFIYDNQIGSSTYRPLISQALNQTDKAEDIINFFSRVDIRNLMQNDVALQEYLNKIISNKVIENSFLKQELLDLIYCQQLSCYQNKFNNVLFYWFVNTKLLEPVLINFAKQNIDISEIINNLTITQILNLEHRDSILKLFNLANINIDNINYSHFYDIFQKLMEYADSNALIKLVYSGLINFLFNSKNALENSLLTCLIEKEDTATIKIIAKASHELPSSDQIDFNERDNKGNTALKLAVIKNDYLCLRALLQTHILNINDTYEDELTALMLAAKYNHVDCIKELIQYANVDINKQENDGYTALMIAVEAENLDCISFLFKRSDINLYLKNSQGETALDIAINCKNYNCLDQFNEQAINIKIADGNTVLMKAIKKQNIDLIRYLFRRHDIKLHAENDKGETALTIAINSKHYDCLEQFDDDAINSQRSDGYTALMHAVETRNVACIRYLLSRLRIDILTKNKKEESALTIAINNGYDDCLDVLINCQHLNINLNLCDAETNITFLMQAVKRNKINCVRKLLDNKKIDINIKTKSGNTALIMAVSLGYTEIVNQLVQDKYININLQNNELKTALIYTLEYKHLDCLKILIENERVDINQQYEFGDTVLIIAAARGYNEAVKLLINNKNIGINSQNHDGWTALMKAAHYKNNSCIKQLLNCENIDTKIKNNQGKNARNIAVSAKNLAGIKALMFK